MNNFAISSDGIANGLQRSASTLVAAGNSLEQSIAMLAAGNKVIQDPEALGNALKVLSMRIRGVKSDLEDAGEETDGMIENTSKLRDKVKALTNVNGNGGVDILTESGAFRSTYDILLDIARVWDQINEANPKNQAALLEVLAGKTRGSQLAAILQNPKDLEAAYVTAMNSAGSAMAENAKYLDSIQGKIDKFTNALQTMWMNFLDTDVIKLIVEAGTGIVDLIDKVGLLRVAFVGLMTYLNASKKSSLDFASMLGIHDIKNGENFLEGFSAFGKQGLTGWVKNVVSDITAQFKKNKVEPVEIPISVDPIIEQPSVFDEGYQSSIDLLNKTAELKKAQDELKKLNSTKLKDIQIPEDAIEYKTGNRRKAYLREVLIPNKEAEIRAIEADIRDITNATRNSLEQNFTELENGQFKIDFDKMVDTKDINLNDLFSDFGIKAQNAINGTFIDFSDWDSAAETIDKFNEKLGQGQQELLNYLPQLNDVDVALQAYLSSLDGGNASLQGFQQFIKQHNIQLKQSGIAAKAAAVGHQLLNAALSVGISFLVSAAISGIMKLANAEKEAAETAKEAAKASEELKKQNESLDDYKQQITELRTSLDSNTLSESEAYDARKKLLSIQDELIDKFGLEKDGINLVTGAINDQIATIDELSRKNAQQWLNNNQKAINNAINYFESDSKGSNLDTWGTETTITNWVPTKNVANMIEEYANNRKHINIVGNGMLGQDINFKGSIEEVKTEVEDFQIWLDDQEDKIRKQLNNLTSLPPSEQTNDVKKQIKSLENDLEQIKDLREDMGKEATKWFGEDSTYASNKALMDEIKQQTALAKYADEYYKIIEAQNAFKEAQAKGDQERMKQALSDLDSATKNAMDAASEGYMGEFFSDLGDEFKAQEFELNVKLNEDGLKTKLEGIIAEGGEKGLSALDDNAIKDMIGRDLNVEGATDASGKYTEEQISGLIALQTEADNAGISIENLIKILTSLGLITGSPVEAAVESVNAVVQAYSTLAVSAETFSDIISQTNEIVSDGTEVSQEYKDALKEIGFSEEELAECFDENNGLIVKNSQKLHKFVQQKKLDKQATIAEARAYAQLNYLKIAKQLQVANSQLIANIKAKSLDIKTTSMFTLATLNNVDALRDQLEELDNTIQQFALLEMQLSKTGEAYKKYQDAKDRDAQLSYDETWLEALKVIDNGILSGAVGTEEFEYAVKLIVPEDVYKTKQELGDIDGMIRSIHDYLDGDPLLANWFTVDEDSGELSYTIDNARAFIKDLIASGAAVGDINDFQFADTINGLSDITDKLNEYRKSLGLSYDVTEATVAAMLSGAEDFDATWGNMFSDALMNSVDRNATEATRAITENQLAMVDLIEQYKNGEITLEDFNTKQTELINKHQELNSELSGSRESAATMCDAFMDINEKLDESNAKLEEYQRLMEKNKDNRNAVGDIIDIDTGENLSDKYADELEKYTQFLSQKKALEDQYGTMTKFTIGLALEDDGVDLENIQDELERTKEEIQSAFETKAVKDLNDELQSTHGVIAKINDDGDIEYTVTDATTEDQMATLNRLDAFKADGTVDINALYSGLTPEQQAEVDKLTSLQDKQNLINYYLTMDGTDSAESALDRLVEVIEDIHELMSQSPIFACNTSDASSKLGGLLSQVSSWVGTHVADFVARVSSIGSTVGGWFKASGNADFSGQSHASGTANNRGKIGLPRAEKDSLVGEFGPELVCSNGRYYTVGDHGAEFVDLPKDAIIFNHLQTRQLLNNGHTNSRGKGRGNLSFASGNAYYGIGSYSPSDANTSFKDGTDMKDWDDIIGGISDAADNISDAADDIADDAEQVVDFIEMKLEEIEAIIEKTSSRIANFLDDTTDIKSKDELYDELVKAEKDKSEAYLKAAQKYNVEAAAALSGVPQQYQEMARNGAIAIEDFIGENQVEIAEKIQEYRDWAAKADEAENGHLEAIAAISAHRVEQLEDIATDFENIVSISKSHSDLLQAEMDFIEESGGRLSESYYEELKKHSQKQLDDMQAERKALQKILDDAVAAGDVVIGSDDWYSMLETIYDVDKEIVDCKTSLEEFQNAINDLYWDNFSKFIDEIDNVNSELSNLYDLISDDDDVVDEMGNWTDKGITALGLLAQQMEVAQQKNKEFELAIEKLDKDFKAGFYSQDEYTEKLSELRENQHQAIADYESAKDAIVDLNKTRVDAVKDGMQKEIDAYSELIEKKKESLSSDKEAYDFQKQVQESNKNIKDIERKIAALAGNTSSSAMAQRKRLEAELLKAQEEQQDMYYNHSIEKQQEALDKELEDYTQNKQDQMDALDEYLKNEEQVITDSFDLVTKNTEIVVGTLTRISEEYGVTISDTIATPWINGTNAIGTYEEQLNTSVSATTKNLESLKKQLEDLQTQADKTADSIVNATHATVVKANDGHQTSIKGYAKGSKSVEKDQWAIIEELGDELQLVPNSAGRLDYIKKGTGILNNTLTERLMNLAMDPTSMIENNRPVIGTPGITTTNNTITIDASVGTLLHVEHLDGSNPAEVAKLVDKAWEKKMQILNNSIKKFTR